jgi:hypothetical protein
MGDDDDDDGSSFIVHSDFLVAENERTRGARCAWTVSSAGRSAKFNDTIPYFGPCLLNAKVLTEICGPAN